jgi:DNA-binding TFAR19-related protein (PDSD5 family)
MPDEELTDARRRKLAKAMGQQKAAAALEGQKRAILRKYLSDGAYARAANVRISSPELFDKLVSVVAQLVQMGRVKDGQTISEEQLVSLLSSMKGPERETSISFHRK